MDFLKKHKKIVLKPMNLMAGKGITSLSYNDGTDFLAEEFNDSRKYVICQKFIDEIINGDTRILITNGVVHEDVLVRYPPENDFRSNLSYGGKYEVKEINKKYLNHLKEVAEYLKYNRIYFAGVDMIGDYITEINITSPTGIKQIEGKNKRISDEISSEFIKIIQNYYEGKK
jgi:glutathione synthase